MQQVSRSAFSETIDPPWYLHWIRNLWIGWQRARGLAREAFAIKDITKLLDEWWAVGREVILLRTERLWHLGAISFTLGALFGMYVRGLFLEYDVIWRSTFIRDPAVVSTIIDSLLGPAAWLTGVNLSDQFATDMLLTEKGVPASLWIHLFAFAAFLIVLVPRSLMYALEGRRLSHIERDREVELRMSEDEISSRLSPDAA